MSEGQMGKKLEAPILTGAVNVIVSNAWQNTGMFQDQNARIFSHVKLSVSDSKEALEQGCARAPSRIRRPSDQLGSAGDGQAHRER